MCRYNDLVSNNYGTVGYCPQCFNVRIRFGNTALAVAHADFIALKSNAQVYLRANEMVADRDEKSIQLLTVSRSIALIYSYNELKRLVVLLNTAYERLKTDLVYIATQG